MFSQSSLSSVSLTPERPGIPHNRPQPPPQGGGDSSAIFFVLFAFLAILAVTILPTSSTLSILHQVPEGHVGVYWRGGALLKTITGPGKGYSMWYKRGSHDPF